MIQTGPHGAPEILRACLATGSARDASRLVEELAADATSRGPMWQLIMGTNLVAFAGFLLARHGLYDRLKATQAAFLEQTAEANALRQALLVREAVALTTRLGAAGVAAAWMKGLWISTCVLDRPGARYMEDIDLLVRPDDYDEAVKVVRSAGFVPETEAAAAEPRPRTGLPFWRPGDLPGSDGAVRLDLHRGISASAERVIDESVFWAAAERRRVQGIGVVVPRPEAGLAMAAIHAFKHGYDLRHLWTAVADGHAILQRCRESLDVDWLERRMAEPTAAAALYLLLRLCGPDGAAGTDASRRLAAAAYERVRAAGAIGAAERILGHVHRLRPTRKGDLILMDVGEQAGVVATARRVAWRIRDYVRREAASDGARPGQLAVAGAVASRLTNWRYSYTTFLVGRLAARITADPGGLPKGQRSDRA